MRIISTERYNELLKYELQVKKATNEVQRKEFCIQRKQKIIDKIDRVLNKLSDNPKKEELQQAIDKINKDINN